MPGPLGGLRVIEFVGIGPGPFAAMMLSDMGAEVIRIQAKGAPKLALLNTKYDVLARGRRSLVMDLKQPSARAAVLALITRADALLEGFRPGVMERLGLSPDECFAHNARLVYGRMTGWGQSGPRAASAGHDINYIALTGVLNAMGSKGLPPSVPLNLVGDFGGGGLILAFGMVCALLEARGSGRGQVVDAAMTDGAALLAAMMFGFKAGGAWSNEREANFIDGAAHYYGTYVCADRKFIALGAIEPQFYAAFLKILDLHDPSLQSQGDRAMWPILKARLAAVFLTKSRDEWAALFAGSDACISPILDWDEAIADPHNRARGTFVDVAGVVQPGPAPRFSRTKPEIARAPACAGEHSEEILLAWGISAQAIANLRDTAAI